MSHIYIYVLYTYVLNQRPIQLLYPPSSTGDHGAASHPHCHQFAPNVSWAPLRCSRWPGRDAVMWPCKNNGMTPSKNARINRRLRIRLDK